MKLIVIGGSGYVGSNLALHMNAEKVAYYSRHKNPVLEKNGIEWIEGSILDSEKVASAIKDYDTVVDAAGIYKEDEQRFFDVHVSGVKNLVNAINKYDTGQRLIYLSAINVHYGQTEFLRTKRTGEDNVALVKNHLNVRPSLLFGNGDMFTEKLFRLASSSISKLPGGGSISPVHVEDLAKVILGAKDIRGAVDVSSRDRISFADAVNIARKKLGKPELKTVDGKLGYSGSVEKIMETGIFQKYEIERFLTDLYRENTYLDRFVKEPASFRQYIENFNIKA
ncbi:MAG: NAD-dependent epimerase/dehydratase family protein [Candidatus Thermoplasmatota archaeon]|nr:NAD-dependent epimerase/dehydratase family protein [Candidatus Thermoplasmatota archaeon]